MSLMQMWPRGYDEGHMSGYLSNHVFSQHDKQCKQTAMSIMQLWP